MVNILLFNNNSYNKQIFSNCYIMCIGLLNYHIKFGLFIYKCVAKGQPVIKPLNQFTYEKRSKERNSGIQLKKCRMKRHIFVNKFPFRPFFFNLYPLFQFCSIAERRREATIRIFPYDLCRISIFIFF